MGEEMTDDFIDAATLDAHIATQPKDWMAEKMTEEKQQVAISSWCRANSMTDNEYEEVGALLCDHSPRDMALMYVRIREAARDLLEATSRTAFHHNTTIKSDPSFGLAGDNIPVDGGSPPTPLTFGHLRRLFAALDTTDR